MKQILDGCTAATYVAYALSDVATVYPITPVAAMGDIAAKWGMQGRKNVFGRPMQVIEMESELGAAGATHGALAAGVTATTFTSSQGLMLMIPNMYKISGELLPGVFHVGTRSLATHALSIFGDHQDIMACRATGFNILMSNSVQEVVDLGIVAHLAALEGSLPIIHAFDGWRTGNEMQTVELPDYDDIAKLVPMDAVERLQKRGMNPDTPDIRGTAQNSDVYFQNREAANKYYDAFPDLVQKYMDKYASLTGRQYHLFEYEGAPDAEKVIIVMGSACETIAETIAHSGQKLGVVKVHLYRPFRADKLLEVIPQTVKSIAVLDRTKEPGSLGEPLYLDVCTALYSRAGFPACDAGKNACSAPKVLGGRFGLSSKDFSPAMVMAVYDALDTLPNGAHFTVGIDDDVTHLSLKVGATLHTAPASQKRFQFYGMGSDGTVGATKQAAQILAELTGDHVQAFFEYSAWKSGGYTVGSLRMDSQVITSEYEMIDADYVGINQERYLQLFPIASRLKQGSLLVINTAKTLEQLTAFMPQELKKAIDNLGVKVYSVDAVSIAAKHSLGVRINTIMEAVFLKLCGMVDYTRSIAKLKDLVTAAYIHEGQDVVANNIAAIDDADAAYRLVTLTETRQQDNKTAGQLPPFIKNLAEPCLHRQGDAIPVSALTPDGTCPLGETAYEKRNIALKVPQWTPSKCVQCTLCSFVCPHAAIRPVVLTPDENENAPFDTVPAKHIPGMIWRIQNYPEDCTGCGSCAVICPGKALDMLAVEPQKEDQKNNLLYCQTRVSSKEDALPRFSVQGSQLYQPLLQFSGACAGCGETPYVKLLTQLFGERMVIANATGCSSIWGADFPSMAYCTNKDGKGPAWANSLFEDNAEFGFGIALGLQTRTDLKTKPSVWAIGGDGWAYDIGYAGLDHVISQNIDINILVMDTECYSNTGGHASKATPLSCIAKYFPDGKRTVKKDLGSMARTYGHVYVAYVSLAANPALTVKILQEAEAYPGPSLIIAYCPCINHGIRAGMSHATTEMREAVKTGYWPLWHYNPQATPAFTLDSAAPDGTLPDFLNGESRYADLVRVDPTAAAKLRPELSNRISAIYKSLS